RSSDLRRRLRVAGRPARGRSAAQLQRALHDRGVPREGADEVVLLAGLDLGDRDLDGGRLATADDLAGGDYAAVAGLDVVGGDAGLHAVGIDAGDVGALADHEVVAHHGLGQL